MKLPNGNTTKKFAFVILCLVATTEVSAQVSWTAVNNDLPANSDVRALAADSANGDVFAGTFGGGVFRSINNGGSWTSDTTGLRDRRVLALAINSSGHIFAGTFGGGVFRSTSNGTNWVELTNLGNSNVLAFAIHPTTGHIFAGTSIGVYRSTNNGDNWRESSTGMTNTNTRAFAINTSGDIFAGTAAGVFRSTNNGNTWAPVNAGLTNPSIRTLAISQSGAIFAGTDAGIFRSGDKGNTWAPINAGLTTLGTYALAINAAGSIFAGTFGGGVFRSTNNGDNWAAANTGLTSLNLQALAVTPSGFLFAGTAGGGAFRTQESTTVGPVLISISPESGNRLQTLDVVFTGTNIIGNSPSVIVGEGITVNSVAEGLLNLTANLTIGADAATGPREFRVRTEGLLGGTSNAKIFTVNNPAPTTTSISPPSKTAGDAGFTLTVNGTNFVSSSVVRFNGTGRTTTLVSNTQLTAAIPASDLTAAGTFDITVLNPAPGGGVSNAQTFTVNNLAPTTTSISPPNKTAGDAGFTMTVNGTNFISSSKVRFNDSERTTFFSSSTQLTATIPASDLITAGTFNISVYNPEPGGGTSNPQTFTVNNPAPTTTSISPPSKTVGDAEFTLTVNGTNFVSTSVVRFNGSDRETVFGSATQLTATISASDLTTAGTFDITVFNPTPGGGTSTAQTFTVNAAANPAPTTTSIAPASKTVGDAQFTMTVTGTNFVSSSMVKFNGADRATNYISSTQLNVTIPASDLTTAGTFDITVFNPTPGGGVSNAQTFTVNNPVPTTTGISPPKKTVGDAGFIMTVTGTNFVSSSMVKFNGADRETNYISGTQLSVTIPASDLSTAGAFEITVSNPTPGGGTSNAQIFTVSPVGNPFPALTSISPTSKIVGDAGFTMTVIGTNFVTGSEVRFNGSPRVTTFVDSTELTAIIPASDLTIAGAFNITVFNPPPGGGISNAQRFTVITADNPIPTLTSILPTSKIVGDAGFIMSVTGTNFIRESVVKFNGSDRPTTFVSRTELVATIPASDLTNAGAFEITVFNPTPGGGTSNAQTFTVSPVDNPVPTLTSISPASKTVGDAAFAMTITGTNFIPSSKVRFNGSDRTTLAGSSAQLTATIPDGDLTTAGTFDITVFNPTPGGGTSTAQTFTVNNPVPTTNSISPLSKTAGDAEFTMTVNGTNFISSSRVRLNGADRSTTFVNSTQLTAIILVTDLTIAGTFNITVFNPTPGGGTSGAQTFTVNPRAVTLTDILPTSGTRLDTLDVVFTGRNFSSVFSSVNVGAGITVNSTTVTSSTSLKANLTITALAATGRRDFSVTNSGLNGGTSEGAAFTVNNPRPTLASIDPNSGGRSQRLEVVFTGTKFLNDASSVEVGQGITVNSTTVTNSTTLRAILTIAANAAPGTRDFLVKNSGPGGGASNILPFTVTTNSAPVITHTPLSSRPRRVPIQVDAHIGDDAGEVSATLHYRQGGEVNFNAVVMTSNGNEGSFQGTIPDGAVTSRGVEYYITATDGMLTTRLPVSGIFSIPIEIDTQYKQTAQPYGSAQNAYRLISVPFDLDNKSPGAVLEDDLGRYDDTKWRFSELLANQAYAEFPNTAPMAPGKAFWLIVTEAGKLIDIDNGKSNRTNAKYAVALHSQWNFVGNPFNFTIPVRNLSLKSSGQSPDLYFYDGAWNDPAGAPVTEMQPFEGYALYSEAAEDTLFIDPDLSSGATSSLDGPETLWSIRILAQSRQARDVNNVATVVPAASRARDRMDHPEPPVVGEYVSVYFPHRDWASPGRDYCTDARPEFSRGEIWAFEVATNIRDQVNLTFEGVAQVPQEFEIWVIDEALRLSQNLRERNQYVVAGAVAGADHPKRLKLVVGRSEFAEERLAEVKVIPASYELSQNFPNPFNPATTIRYGLPKAERVRVTIYNLLGEEVVRLVEDEPKEAGYHAAIWDGRNQHAQAVASGIYLYRLRAGSFVMTKKMVLVQ